MPILNAIGLIEMSWYPLPTPSAPPQLPAQQVIRNPDGTVAILQKEASSLPPPPPPLPQSLFIQNQYNNTNPIIPHISSLIIPCPICKIILKTTHPIFKCPCGQLISIRY